MLPFLKPNKIAAVIIAHHKPEGGLSDEKEEGEAAPKMMEAAEALISAIHMKDAKAVAEALEQAMGGE